MSAWSITQKIVILWAVACLFALAGCAAGASSNSAAESDDDSDPTVDDDSAPVDDDSTPDDDSADDDSADDDSMDDDSMDDDTTPPIISNEQVVANPVCDLSCIVTWTTQTPATSWVHFGEGSQLSWRIGDDALVTEHEVLVIGMHADTAYRVQIFTASAGGATATKDLQYTTGSLPDAGLVNEVDVDNPNLADDGWILFNMATSVVSSPVPLVIVDRTGQPVWYYNPDDIECRADIQATWMDGSIIMGPGVYQGQYPIEVDLQGNVLWQGPEQPIGEHLEGSMHHVFYPIDDNQIITVMFSWDEAQTVWGDVIWIFDRELNTIWDWTLCDHVQVPAGTFETHSNSAAVDEELQETYLSTFGGSKLLKIDMTTGDVIWSLPMPTECHALNLLANKHILYYANKCNTAKADYSCVREIEINESGTQATVVWEYPGSYSTDTWFNTWAGDVMVLPNGNILIHAGNGYLDFPPGQSPSRFIEVTRSGEKVWQMWMADGVGAYKMDRLPALAQPLDAGAD